MTRLGDERQVIFDEVFNKKKVEKKPDVVAAPIEESKTEEPTVEIKVEVPAAIVKVE